MALGIVMPVPAADAVLNLMIQVKLNPELQFI
jgi:hypothetical protein